MSLEARLPDLVTLLVVSLVLFGLIMVYSATASMARELDTGLPSLFLKQAFFAAAGLIGFFVISRIDYPKWERIMPFAIWGVIILLVLVFTPLGREIRGTRAWLRLGPFTLQPSEFAKLGLITYLAVALKRRNDPERTVFQRLIWPAILTAATLGLILLQGDKGMTLFVSGVVFLFWFISGARMIPIAATGVLFAVGMWLVVHSSDYARQRVEDYKEKFRDTPVESFQLRQAKVAMNSGRVYGQGIGGGMTVLPDRHTDFIFPIVGEELGFAGAVSLIAILLLLIVIGATVAVRCPDLLGTLLAAGVTILVGCQIVLNLCVATGVAPTTGIGLPFISYGGSSLVTTLAAMGILVNVARPGEGGIG